jgi:hypothetical protein
MKRFPTPQKDTIISGLNSCKETLEYIEGANQKAIIQGNCQHMVQDEEK